MRRFPHWQLAFLAGTLLGLSYPPLHLGFLAWVAFLPLFSIWSQNPPRQAAVNSYLAGTWAHLLSLYWIGFNSGAAFWVVLSSLIAAVLYLGIFWALLGGLLSFLYRKHPRTVWFWPLGWITLEWVRSFGPLGFPWANLAVTQSQFDALVQITDVTGSYGVSGLILLV
ncbi:MAG: hypothetical protein D6762_06340, partial [Candidatus Neomarinimicrobiota bacterium]